MPLPDITDRPETLLFDWEDFEVADGLEKLPEVIATRERFEEERANLTVESDRQKVEQVMGISKSQANRVLMKLRGGKIERVPFHEQIHSLLESGEKTTAELIAAIEGHPGAVKNELKRLVDIGEIVKVRRAVYALPSE
jgi:predicted transcriptional regulator